MPSGIPEGFFCFLANVRLKSVVFRDQDILPIVCSGTESTHYSTVGILGKRRDALAMQIVGQASAVELPWAHLRIPPFPQVAIRILQLTDSEVAPMRQLSTLISSDPAFSSEVLTIANSALYATRFPITSVLQAIAILGTDSLKGLCLTVGVRAYLGKSLRHHSMRAIWRHSMACALVAQKLAVADSLDKNAAYSAGIMHDIGRLALAVIAPGKYASLLEDHRGSSASALVTERELLGLDHCETGSHLVTDWKLPTDFALIVSSHHRKRHSSDSWHMADLINVSCRIADTLGFTVFPHGDVEPYADLQEELPERERSAFCPDKEQLAFEISSKINAAEIV
jgi:putative nucleotidyltransferase with HDIG domain